MPIGRIQTAGLTQGILLPQGLNEARSSFPFQILVTNISRKPVALHKNMCIVFDEVLFKIMAKANGRDGLNPTVEVNNGPYKDVKVLQTHILHHTNVKREDAERKAHY